MHFLARLSQYRSDGIKFGAAFVSVAAVWAIGLVLTLIPLCCCAHMYRFLALLVSVTRALCGVRFPWLCRVTRTTQNDV